MTNDIRTEPPAQPTPQTVAADGRPPWAALVALLIGTFITAIDFFIVNVALPAVQADLHTNTGDVEWLVAAYSLGVASCLLMTGRLGDRIGRRRAFTIGIAGFTAASLLCTVAPNAGVLIAGRLVQGIGTAFIMTSVLSMISALFVGAARARAISAYAAVLGIGAAAGQIIGGLLVTSDALGIGWRSIFAINVPVGILALVLTPLVIPATRGAVHRLDAAGMLLMSAAVVALVLPLIDGRDAAWAPWVWICLGLAPVLVALFLLQQRRLEAAGGEPMFPRMLLRAPAFRSGLLWQFVFWCGQASFYVVLTMYLQLGRGMSPLDAGLLFLGLAVPYLVAVTVAPRVMARIGRRVLVIGAACNIAGFAALAAVAASGVSVLWLLIGLSLCGVAQGLSIPPSTRLVLATATPQESGIVSGALSTLQQVGGSLGVAIVGALFFGIAGSVTGARSGVGAGIANAYVASLLVLAIITAATVALSFLLPKGETR